MTVTKKTSAVHLKHLPWRVRSVCKIPGRVDANRFICDWQKLKLFQVTICAPLFSVFKKPGVHQHGFVYRWLLLLGRGLKDCNNASIPFTVISCELFEVCVYFAPGLFPTYWHILLISPAVLLISLRVKIHSVAEIPLLCVQTHKTFLLYVCRVCACCHDPQHSHQQNAQPARMSTQFSTLYLGS